MAQAVSATDRIEKHTAEWGGLAWRKRDPAHRERGHGLEEGVSDQQVHDRVRIEFGPADHMFSGLQEAVDLGCHAARWPP